MLRFLASSPLKFYNHRSNLILEKWNPLLQSFPDDIHWALSGEFEAFYVPSDSRKSY